MWVVGAPLFSAGPPQEGVVPGSWFRWRKEGVHIQKAGTQWNGMAGRIAGGLVVAFTAHSFRPFSSSPPSLPPRCRTAPGAGGVGVPRDGPRYHHTPRPPEPELQLHNLGREEPSWPGYRSPGRGHGFVVGASCVGAVCGYFEFKVFSNVVLPHLCR